MNKSNPLETLRQRAALYPLWADVLIPAADMIEDLTDQLAKHRTGDCYQCGRAGPLSKRSRCVECEHGRAVANETENDHLRDTLVDVCDKLAAGASGPEVAALIKHRIAAGGEV